MPSVFIKTYGCQMNVRDSEAVAAQLVAKGYSLAGSEQVADVVLLNTCSVRDSAEQKAIGKMRSLVGELRRKRPGVVLGFLGCMAQSRGRELIDTLPDVDLVLGTQKFHRAPEHLDALLQGRQSKVCDTTEESGSAARIREHLLDGAGPRKAVTAFVSIMQGCNQHCTFCIVPQTRGAERSRTIPDLIAECEELVDRGVREVTLLGQIVTSFGRRDHPVRDGLSPFVQLLEAVEEVEGLERIRFTSPHPKGYGDDLVAAFGRLSKLCESAHLPAQSGSNAVLKRMHRGYTRERFMELAERLREVQPKISLTTDLIVGFPGETDRDFQDTLDLVEQVRFDNAFVFKYSKRKDTPAADLPDQVPGAVIEERHARLLGVVNRIASERLNGLIGQRLEVLVEGPSRKNPARLEGRTRCNRIVILEGSERHCGQLLDVEMKRASNSSLYGELVLVDVD